jgi:5'-3' exonuclease
MGIPGYFYRLVKKYSSVLIKYSLPKSQNQKVNLYFDYNGIIHTAGRLAKSNKYEDIYKSITDYTKTLINIVKPTGIIYIAIDGVAPMAKIKQQRMRRFKQVEEEQSTSNFNMVSPGTLFMKNLSIHLKNTFPNAIISDDYEPSEGEHKIIKQIKLNDSLLNNNEKNLNIIYGMDADLIILALSLFKENIWIVREDSYVFGKSKNLLNLNDPKMIYLDIYSLRNKIIDELKSNLLSIEKDEEPYYLELNNNRYIIDYIFMSFFIGNDFLPSFEAIKIKSGGIETLINIYTLLDDFLINEDLSINYSILIEFLTILEEKEINLLIYNKHLLDKIPNDNVNINSDLINIKTYGWTKRYYNYFFNNSNDIININENTNINSNENINKYCFEYLKGLTWNLKYYFEGCNDWLWYYPYNGNVLITDLLRYLKINSNLNSSFKFNIDSKPISQEDQLLMILPLKDLYLIKSNDFIKKLIEDKEITEKYYPEKFKLLTYGKMYYYEFIPIIPCVNLELINNWKSSLN